MQKTIEFFNDQIKNIRTGQISPALISAIRFENDLIGHIALVNNGKKCVTVSPYDLNKIGVINKVLESHGFNCYVASKSQIVVNHVLMTEEEKNKIIVKIKRFSEDAKISIRNIRKKFRSQDDIDELTKMFVANIDEITELKLRL